MLLQGLTSSGLLCHEMGYFPEKYKCRPRGICTCLTSRFQAGATFVGLHSTYQHLRLHSGGGVEALKLLVEP